MYYRRKILLALIEVFEGRLKKTDCQKLLFLFCQLTGKNHYDFFPYHFGAFSFTAYYDKNRLTAMGLLRAEEDFHLYACKSFLSEVHPSDQSTLHKLSSQLQTTRGKELIRRTYLEYPHFACRSKIVHDLLKASEIERVRYFWNNDNTPCLFTLGYEKLTIDAYLNRLIVNNIAAVIDVRNNPQSMKYGFSKKALSDYVESAGLKYFHIPELGIPSTLRKNLGSLMSYKKLFEQYETQIIPKQTAALRRLRTLLAEHGRVTLMCFETNHLFCHRHKIVNFLKRDGSFKTSVVHL
jgi:uncharacterized protein (DUF488 family)